MIKVEDVGKGVSRSHISTRHCCTLVRVSENVGGSQDDTRYWKVKGEEAAWKADSGPISNYFAAVNRNKRSVCLNLKHEKGRKVLLQLVKETDVV